MLVFKLSHITYSYHINRRKLNCLETSDSNYHREESIFSHILGVMTKYDFFLLIGLFHFLKC